MRLYKWSLEMSKENRLLELAKKIQTIEQRLTELEGMEKTPAGEGAGQSAYYRPGDSSLHTPGAIIATGNVSGVDLTASDQVIYSGHLTPTRSAIPYTAYAYVPLQSYVTFSSATLTVSDSSGTIFQANNVPAATKAVNLRIFAKGTNAGDWVCWGPGNTTNETKYHAPCYVLEDGNVDYNGINAIVAINSGTAQRLYRTCQVTSGQVVYSTLIIGYFI